MHPAKVSKTLSQLGLREEVKKRLNLTPNFTLVDHNYGTGIDVFHTMHHAGTQRCICKGSVKWCVG